MYIGFWVTNTFVLNAAPYHFDTYVYCILTRSSVHCDDRLAIVLFGLVGIASIASSPPVGRLIDHLVPWTATLISLAIIVGSQVITTAAGTLNIAAVVVATISKFFIFSRSTPS